ncbi:MAG: hypothetical protein Ct9H300mP11_15710 [Chloroflexota bacterium]|nr:MAG: hypothetical protein Ct9H300mP11_15710 [Chloroflexota bacterium]
MSIESVAILSPGDMGHAIGQLLKEHEMRVLTCLSGRSTRTKELSEKGPGNLKLTESKCIGRRVRRFNVCYCLWSCARALP